MVKVYACQNICTVCERNLMAAPVEYMMQPQKSKCSAVSASFSSLSIFRSMTEIDNSLHRDLHLASCLPLSLSLSFPLSTLASNPHFCFCIFTHSPSLFSSQLRPGCQRASKGSPPGRGKACRVQEDLRPVVGWGGEEHLVDPESPSVAASHRHVIAALRASW